MPAYYSEDLRTKVIEAINKKIPILRISKTFGIARNTVYNWKKLQTESGSIQRKKTKPGRQPIITDLEKFKAFIKEKPDRTQQEIAEEWGGVSPRTICTVMKRAGLTYKKKLWIPTKKSRKKSSLSQGN
jgi:transposase